jgi:hypothetical protein
MLSRQQERAKESDRMKRQARQDREQVLAKREQSFLEAMAKRDYNRRLAANQREKDRQARLAAKVKPLYPEQQKAVLGKKAAKLKRAS